MIINDMVRTGLALLLILGASAAKRHSLRVMDDILLEEDASFWGRDLQMSMPTPPSDEFGSKYVADLGKYGRFELVTTLDDSKMNWKVDIRNIDELAEELGIPPITSLNYHLHQQWTNGDKFFDIGGDGCGADVTGGHYDPYFACGPASGVDADTCAALGRPKGEGSMYSCSPEVFQDEAMLDRCEVGDLSGKYGQVIITEDGWGYEEVENDPLPALDYQFVSGIGENPPNFFSTIIFHVGAPRVLCGRLFEVDI